MLLALRLSCISHFLHRFCAPGAHFPDTAVLPSAWQGVVSGNGSQSGTEIASRIDDFEQLDLGESNLLDTVSIGKADHEGRV
ncbi:hypothetical protein ROA7450_03799 [Roseovarius albus]|uniref:Uncharacterized protein n=1 Tax=Roseovarius albus TaxID=1247867 RepID=A0A1X7A3Z5_9RHOB|nr:hypothetical protein ROA7450_03799 [Roseovarius albus]